MVYNNNIIVCVKVDGKILREHGEYVTLPFNSEYSILIKNLSSRKALVGIEIDGKDVLDGDKLIVGANSSIELEGFKKGNRVTNKFKFVKKTKDISEYRGDRIDDGFIRVEATFENPIWYTAYTYTYNYNPNDFIYTYYSNTTAYNSPTAKCDTVDFACCNKGINSTNNTNNTNGITVKGNNDSKQSFVSGSIGALENNSHIIIIRLKGIDSNKNETKLPVFVSTKLKCETCGTVSKSSAKFCRNCGTCLI